MGNSNNSRGYVEKILKATEKVLYWLSRLYNYLKKKMQVQDASHFEDMAPTLDITNGEEYQKALEWAFNNNNVTNIALTGPYGSGKSSIIKSYIHNHFDRRIINISLAKFDNTNGNINLENEILTQLFYKVKHSAIPQSRYRKLHKVSKKIIALYVTLTITSAIGIFFILFPEKFKNIISALQANIGIIGCDAYWYSLFLVVIFVLAIYLITNIVKWAINHFNILEIGIDKKTKLSIRHSKEENVFNKNMDEIVYFFEETKVVRVFIEDIDRYDDTSIFVKLRDLNSLLNKYDGIKNRVVFIYAIKDEMFKDTDRTKFFDFIIPVIPVINSTNSDEILKDKLMMEKQEDGLFKSKIHDISQSYINKIAPYISDMRVLISICNEFHVYKKILCENQKLDLKDEKLFSMVVFKNLYPADFAELEMEKGAVKMAFSNKKVFIEKKAKELDSENKNNIKQIEDIENEIFNDISELKLSLLNIMTRKKGAFVYCSTLTGTKYYNDILEDDFDLSLLRNQNIRVYYHNNSGIHDHAIDIDDELKKNNEKFFERLDIIRNKAQKKREIILSSITKNKETIDRINSYNLSHLISMYGAEEIFDESVLDNKFLVFLLRHGYIDESYKNYINYFRPNSITPDEMNFILGIRNYKKVGDYTYSLPNKAQVVDRIEDIEFKQKEVLNFDIVDYLLDNMERSNKTKYLIKQLSDRSDESKNFIKAYISRNKYTQQFVQNMCKSNKYFCYDLYYDTLLTSEDKILYFSFILRCADIEDIIKNNIQIEEGTSGVVSNFIIDNSYILSNSYNIPISRLKDLIIKLNLKLTKVETKDTNRALLLFIFNKLHYELNNFNINALFDIKYPTKKNNLDKCNYTTILETGDQILIDYVNKNIIDYVKTFIIVPNKNNEESFEAIISILKQLFCVDIELCNQVIEKQNYIWQNIVDCNIANMEDEEEVANMKQLWKFIVKQNKMKATWKNFYEYYNLCGITNEIIDFLEINFDMLVSDNNNSVISDDIVKELITEPISIHLFEKIIETFTVEEFTNDLDEFSEEEISLMIDKNYFDFSISRLNELIKVFPDLVEKFIVANLESFYEIVDEVELPYEIIISLIKNDAIESKNKNIVFSLIRIEDIDEDAVDILIDMKLNVDKAYIEKAWEISGEQKEIDLLSQYCSIYDFDEISVKLTELGRPYSKFADRDRRHKEYLSNNIRNYTLLKRLYTRGYLTSITSNKELADNPIQIYGMVKKR